MLLNLAFYSQICNSNLQQYYNAKITYAQALIIYPNDNFFYSDSNILKIALISISSNNNVFTNYVCTQQPHGCLAVTIWKIFIHSGIFSLWSTIFFFRWETLTQAEGGGKLMVAASKAAQILAQMFGKLQKYGLGKQAARSPSFGPGLQWERKGELCVLSAGACSDDKDQETRQKLFSNATLRIHYRVYIHYSVKLHVNRQRQTFRNWVSKNVLLVGYFLCKSKTVKLSLNSGSFKCITSQTCTFAIPRWILSQYPNSNYTTYDIPVSLKITCKYLPKYIQIMCIVQKNFGQPRLYYMSMYLADIWINTRLTRYQILTHPIDTQFRESTRVQYTQVSIDFAWENSIQPHKQHDRYSSFTFFYCRRGMTQIKKEQKTPRRPTKNDLRGLTVRPILIYNMAAPPKGHELNYQPDTKKLFSKCQLVHFRAASAGI